MTNITAPAIRPTTCARCGAEIPGAESTCPACGLSLSAGTAVLAAMPATAARPSEEALVRSALAPDYELLDELGRGGMAIVYRARDVALQRDVAIKVLPVTRTFEAEVVDRFQQEARTAARLEHPHIIPIYRVGQSADGSVCHFAMKLLRGGSLSARLREGRVLAPAELRRMLREVGEALAYAAGQGVVHRDIKPDNIMLDEAGRFVVTDFGIARSAAAPRLTATGMSVGTPRYMSPEQARAKPLDGRSDIYSLGIVAYECLVGRTPFDGDDGFAILYSHIHSALPRPVLSSTEEWDLFDLIERMTRKKPEARVQDGTELLRLLGDLDLRATALPADTGAPALGRGAQATATRALSAFPVSVARHFATARRALGPRLRLVLATIADVRRRGVSVASAAVARARAVPAVAWSTATPRRTLAVILAMILVVIGGGPLAHAALHHRPACPDRPPGTDWSVHVHVPGARPQGSALVMHYDVCGLEPGTAYSARVAIERDGGAIRRLFGGPSPIVERYDEVAHGPAARRHRRFELDGLPAGSYSVVLEVEREGARRQREVAPLRIMEQ